MSFAQDSSQADAMSTPPVLPLACANWVPGSDFCRDKGKFACGNCNLVLYCGKECQTAHWATHKLACRSPKSKESWRPAWDRENRDPAWAQGAARNNAHNPYGGNLYLWGNMPAIDILRLPDNEGAAYTEEIDLLFAGHAASGDLRNVVKTIADLPTTVTQPYHVTVNDKDFSVVARNAILLLFALNAPSISATGSIDPFDAAEALMHLWYSAFVPDPVLATMLKVVKPLISVVNLKIASEDDSTSHGKTWHFPSGRSLRLVFTKSQWLKLEQMLDTSGRQTSEEACNIRHAVVLAPERADYRDRWDFKEPTPFTRLAKHQFREDGLLLPFGHPRIGFDQPNITLFQGSKTWLMDDKRDPIDGWPVFGVLHTPSLAKEDLYGKLYLYVRGGLSRFLDRLTTATVDFELYCLDARELQNSLSLGKYMRIEVSNISDNCHVGCRETLASLSPLLQSPQVNPHATIITLFLNAVLETAKRSGTDQMPNTDKIFQYLSASPAVLVRQVGAEMYRIWDARTLFYDVDKLFEAYRHREGFDGISTDLRVAEKKRNTVVEKWPMTLKLRPGQAGAQEEFRAVLGSNFSGTERYVEWKRVA